MKNDRLCEQCGLISDYVTPDKDGKNRCNCCKQDNIRTKILTQKREKHDC